MRSRDLIFLGPSLSHEDAREIYPEAMILPPAAMGDILSAVRRFNPHAIALIDGSFFQTMATYHKELIEAMSLGIWVIGSSSMGALRAAECSEFGMIGVGQIYEAFATGELEDDDEVAISHLSVEYDYMPVTDAMVDIRATLGAARDQNIISDGQYVRLCELQKNRWFMERHLLNSLTDAQEIGIEKETTDALMTFFREFKVSVKANDARLAIARLRDLPEGPIPLLDRPKLALSSVYVATSARDVVVHSDLDDPITFDKIRRFVTLTERNSDTIWRQVRERTALYKLMAAYSPAILDVELEQARNSIAADLGIPSTELDSACYALDMTPSQVSDWVTEEAYVLRAAKWVKSAGVYSLHTTEFLNQIRRRGGYRDAKRGAAFQEFVAASSAHKHSKIGLKAAMAVYQQMSEWHEPSDLDEYIDKSNFGSRAEFYERLMTAVATSMDLFDMNLIDPNLVANDELDHFLTPKTSRGG